MKSISYLKFAIQIAIRFGCVTLVVSWRWRRFLVCLTCGE